MHQRIIRRNRRTYPTSKECRQPVRRETTELLQEDKRIPTHCSGPSTFEAPKPTLIAPNGPDNHTPNPVNVSSLPGILAATAPSNQKAASKGQTTPVVVHRLSKPKTDPHCPKWARQSHPEPGERIQPTRNSGGQCPKQPKSGLERTNDSPPTRKASQKTSSGPRQAHDREFRVILEPSDPQLHHIARLSANRNLRRSAAAAGGIPSARLKPSARIRRPLGQEHLGRSGTLERRMRPALIVPLNESRQGSAKAADPERDQDAPQVFLLHSAHETLNDGNAAVAPDRAKPGLHARTSAPLAVFVAELSALVRNDVARGASDPLRRLELEHLAHQCSPPAERPALDDRQRHPRHPEATGRHERQVHVPDVVNQSRPRCFGYKGRHQARDVLPRADEQPGPEMVSAARSP